MEVKKISRKGVYLLPNFITSLSLFSGFLALTLAAAGHYERAVFAVIFSALMDGLDGKVARLTNTASDFGIQYDSLADLVSFGVAPAILMWHWQLHAFGRVGLAICFIFTACAALRLARFNVSTATTSKKFFIGLPSPAAGCGLVSFVLFSSFIPEFLISTIPYVTLVLTLFFGILMVSRVRYYSFKEDAFLRAKSFSFMVAVVLVLGLLATEPKLLSFLIAMFYVLAGLIYTFIYLPKRDRELVRTEDLEEHK